MTERFIPYGKQWVSDDDIREIIEVLKSDWLTQGPKIKEFEDAVARYVGARHAVAVANGTAALHLAYMAAGLREGNEVITTPVTFLATANAALYCGSRPVFADIDGTTCNVQPRAILEKISPKTKLIVPVHFGGRPCDMVSIHAIAKDHGLMVVEDACHALGAKYQWNNEWVRVGRCAHSDMTVFSFHPVKHITTGEGGMITTNNRDLYENLLILRNHGIVRDPKKFKNADLAFTNESPNPWYYEFHSPGFNYRITDVQCALGISQLKKAEMFVQRRREIAAQYNNAFEGIQGIVTPQDGEATFSSYHLYALQINFGKFSKTRQEFMEELKKKNIGTQVHYIPIHLQPYYREQLQYQRGDYPCAEDFYTKEISLPLYPKMTDKEVRYVISAVKTCLRIA